MPKPVPAGSVVRSFASILLLALVGAPVGAQDSVDLDALRARPEYRVLAGMHGFYGTHTGGDGDASDGMLALRLLLEQRGAREAFLRLLDEAPAGGQLYALCGLWLLDPEAFDARVEPFLSDERWVEFNSGGCSDVRARVRDLVRSDSPWAVRLEGEDRARANWGAWVEEQGWPDGAYPVLDVVGGGWPLALGRHDCWRSSRGVGDLPPEQRSVSFWVDELLRSDDERRAPEANVAYRLSRFGPSALDALAEHLQHRDVRVRRDVAQVHALLGVEPMGLRVDEVARRLGRMLWDPDSTVHDTAAEGLEELGPWSAPALLDLLAAMERLPAELTGEREHTGHRLAWAARRAGEAPVARLLPLLEHRLPEVQSYAVAALGDARAEAGVAGAALCALLGSADPERREAVAWALGSLAGPSGRDAPGRAVALGNAELTALHGLLRDPEATVVRAAAQALGCCGARAGAPSIDALTAALERADCVHLRAELVVARWRITSDADGLVSALLASRASPRWEIDGRRDRLGEGPDADVLDSVLRGDPARRHELALALRPPLPDPQPYAASAARMALEHLRWLGPVAADVAPDVRRLLEVHGSAHWISQSAAETLRLLTGDTEPCVRVARAQLRGDDPAERRRALQRLEHLGPAAAPAVPVLGQLMRESRNPEEIARAAHVLVAGGPTLAEVSVPLLTELMDEPPSRDVQIAAVWALGQLASAPAAHEALQRATESSDDELARRARSALRELAAR